MYIYGVSQQQCHTMNANNETLLNIMLHILLLRKTQTFSSDDSSRNGLVSERTSSLYLALEYKKSDY